MASRAFRTSALRGRTSKVGSGVGGAVVIDGGSQKDQEDQEEKKSFLIFLIFLFRSPL
jgi:hypothetical protein